MSQKLMGGFFAVSGELTQFYEKVLWSIPFLYGNTARMTCAAGHTVNHKGISIQLKGTDYYNDYWASVVLIHFMREGDQKMAIPELIKKYPYREAKEIVMKGWK